jgi:Kef-type K+ transport system membrane component KefB
MTIPSPPHRTDPDALPPGKVTGERLARRYLLLVLLPIAAALVLLVWQAQGLPSSSTESAAGAVPPWRTPLTRFLLQLLVVLALAKSAGWLLQRCGQPAVIGEMLAGIVLGPSLLGAAAPALQGWLFPPDSLAPLGHVSQLGVLIFMFAAGAEFDLGRLRGQRRLALVLSHAGIALPFALGLGLAWALYPRYAPAGTGLASFALFVGIALSVTAFPVLLRILDDRGYRMLPIGMLAIACAAISDVTAWTALAAVVAWTQSQGLAQLALNSTLALALGALLLGVARPRLQALEIAEVRRGRATILLILGALGCALLTELIGLHLLFGAFVAGMAVSGNAALRRLVQQHIEPFALALLLPLFFARTGLDTRIDLLSGAEWALCAAIVALATLGKFGGTVVAARLSDIPRADALRLGALMNTRGLMELIVLGLGLQLGLIDTRLYAILVLVAIVTTVGTAPMLAWIDRRGAPSRDGFS